MAPSHLPPDVQDVLGPLREADGYARLQFQRQRGVHDLLTGLPGLFFVFVFWSPFPGFPWAAAVHLAALALFLLACLAPKAFLPAIRHRRPDWESAFVDASLLDRALEKRFWLQAPFFMLHLNAPVAIGLLVLVNGVPADGFLWILAWTNLAIQGGGTVALAVQARRSRDHLVQSQYWTMALLAPLHLLLALEEGVIPGAASTALVVSALCGPPLLAGAFRLLAPRRWLVR